MKKSNKETIHFPLEPYPATTEYHLDETNSDIKLNLGTEWLKTKK